MAQTYSSRPSNRAQSLIVRLIEDVDPSRHAVLIDLIRPIAGAPVHRGVPIGVFDLAYRVLRVIGPDVPREGIVGQADRVVAHAASL